VSGALLAWKENGAGRAYPPVLARQVWRASAHLAGGCSRQHPGADAHALANRVAAGPRDTSVISRSRRHLSVKTIESHRTHINEKLNLKNTMELVLHAIHWQEA
jgi:Bacterial regulatory proteins, luxR family